MTVFQVVIPFRDRGKDMRRTANLEIVMAWWWAHNIQPLLVTDGLTGDAQFNRHKAYNEAVKASPNAEVFVFTEADMLIPIDQIAIAMKLAVRKPGLIVPFTRYRYLSDGTTATLRDAFHDLPSNELASWIAMSTINPQSIFNITPESTMENGKSIGAVNVVSRETLEITGGFTEATSGNWYDDNIINEGFAFLTGQRTQWVPGPAVHLYHLPGWTGEHLTDEDRAATQRNKNLLGLMRHDITSGNREAVQDLMKVRGQS